MVIIYAIFAVIGLGFLVFIHELGHYLMAKRVGMRVEEFAIGFGPTLFSWKSKDGVDWKICSLPFGGYVKIAGMQKEGDKEPHEIPDGFFGSKPLDRIKVAFMGPFVNILFAFFAFSALFLSGGREKSFTEFTKRIGWMDESSALYQKGVRPGDEISALNNRPFRGAKDLLLASVMMQGKAEIAGKKIDYIDQETSSFRYVLTPYQDPRRADASMQTLGVLSPASYLIYEDSRETFPGSPIKEAGILGQDRIFWVDGHLIFSLTQLKSVLEEKSAFLTVERNGAVFHSKIPRISLDELSLNSVDEDALRDLRYDASLTNQSFEDLLYLPYLLSEEMKVEKPLRFIDTKDEEKAFSKCTRCPFFSPLKPGDRILAIDGKRVRSTDQLFQEIQKKRSLIIVQRDPKILQEVSWKAADSAFDRGFPAEDLEKIVAAIGTDSLLQEAGSLHLLKPISPLPIEEFPPSEQKEHLLKQFAAREKEILTLDSPEKRDRYLQLLQKQKKQPYLGAYLHDRVVLYNPDPLSLIGATFVETGGTLQSLFSGNLHPKWLSGPVGIVSVVQHSWTLGYKEALFWMGLISLNLAIFNLLPIPVLDGGHITLSLVEMVTKKPIKAKTMERLVLPFVLLFIGFFFFVTYHDILRLFFGVL